jgi:DmsE family decaheme c-type cytochrome
MKWLMFLCVLSLSFCMPLAAQEPDAAAPVKRISSYTQDGAEACLRCHSGEKMRAIEKSVHGDMENMYTPLATQGCEACHGPGSIHVSRAHGGAGFPKMVDFGRGGKYSPREIQIETCLACHQGEKGGASAIEWHGSSHNRKSINCTTCHTVHVETEPMHDADLQVARCSRCHRKDIEKHKQFEEVNIDFESLSCGTCHNVHQAFDREERHAESDQ